MTERSTERSAAPDCLLDIREVAKKTSLGMSTIYRYVSTGKFPRPVGIGERCVRWRESEIDAWIAALPTVSAAEVRRSLPPAAAPP